MLLDAEAGCSVILNAAAMLDRADAGSAADRALVRIVTPLAKYWLTARARVVAGDAMNVRGGNGYIEEWVNARLVRDAHLGAIWEGSTNVVALDVQRAILRDGGVEALAGFVQGRLDTVGEPHAKRWADVVAGTLADLRRRVAAWPGLDETERELDARPVADALYHALAGALLLAEGETLWQQRGSARKLAAAALYLKKWLRPPAPPASIFAARECALLPALIDWTPVAADALAASAPGGCRPRGGGPGTSRPAPGPTVRERPPDDPTLLARLRAGDARAFEELVTTYQHRIFGVALRMLGSRAEAEDVAQETFLRAHRALGEFRGEARLGTWLYA